MPKSADLLEYIGYSFFALGLAIAVLSIYLMLTASASVSFPRGLDSAIYLSTGLLICAGTLLIGLPFFAKNDVGFVSDYPEGNIPQARNNPKQSINATRSPTSDPESNEE